MLRQRYLELKTEDKKLALAAREGAAQNHFSGVGAVMNTAVSFSTDDDDDLDLGLDDEGDFIDGGKWFPCLLGSDEDR